MWPRTEAGKRGRRTQRGASLPEAIFRLAVAKGLAVHELKVEEGRLDELFREITRRDTDD